MLRSTALRRDRRVTTSAAPIPTQGTDIPKPGQRCCPCCAGTDCQTPNAHDDGGCKFTGHEWWAAS